MALMALALACIGGSWRQTVDAATSSALQPTPTIASSVCPSKTVNYITHRLPQQCLKTSWTQTNAVNATGVETVVSATDGQAISITSAVIPRETPRAHANGTSISQYDASGQGSTASNDGTKPLQATSVEASAENAQGSISMSASVTASIPSAEVPKAEHDAEADSALDTANFLSFEEWKRRNLAGSGQNPDGLADRRLQGAEGKARQRPRSINSAIDSLGDDAEIDLDFARFTTSQDSADVGTQGANMGSDPTRQGNAGHEQGEGSPTTPKPRSRSRDAGKTCKERFNYASFDCAATVLKTNPECKGASSILVENKDSYMLNECSATNQFFIVELCDDILIDTIVLGNFEFFSSIFRTFRVSVSDRYPVKTDKWRELGTFEARNSRELQAFAVENPLIWARYVRVELLTHFGMEFFCPISLFRVHGTTMMEEFKNQEEAAKGEEEAEEDVGESGSSVEVPAAGGTAQASDGETSVSGEETKEVPANASQTLGTSGMKAGPGSEAVHNTSTVAEGPPVTPDGGKALQTLSSPPLHFNKTPSRVCDANSTTSAQGQRAEPRSASETISSEQMGATTLVSQPSSSAVSKENAHQNGTKPASVLQALATQNGTTVSQGIASTRSAAQPSQEVNRTSSTSTHPPAANPTTQESFFKTIHKRLQLLEANATLSLQYIEEQSQILRDAFAKVEKRQLAKSTSFLKELNATVFAELRGFVSVMPRSDHGPC